MESYMSQFENSEIMQEYARIAMAPAIVKEAASSDWGEAILSNVATEAAVIGAAKAALALGVTGKAAAVAGMFAPAGPAGWAAMALILGATIVWQATKLADDNLDDLVERFEDLDPKDEQTKAQIEKVTGKLKEFKAAMGVQDVPESEEEKLQQTKGKLNALTELTKYLVSLKEWFPTQLKPKLTDWGYGGLISGDAEQAEQAIDKTLTAMLQLKEKAASEQKAVMQKAVEEYGQTLNKDLAELGQKVKSMYDQLSERFGGPPKFDNKSEEAGYNLAEALASKSATLEDVKNNVQSLVMLHGLFEKALGTAATTASSKERLSKRALTLGDGTQVTLRGPAGAAKKERTQRQLSRRNPAVTSMQQSLNYLNQAYSTGASRINEDGIYGPNTQKALETFMNSSPRLRQWMNVPQTDYRVVGKNPAVLNAISQKVNTLSQTVQQSTQPGAAPQERQTGVQYGGGTYDVEEQPHKWNPTGAEILAALNNKFIDGTPAQTWLANRGFSRENQVRLVSQVFKGPRGLPPPSDWSMPMLQDYVKRNYGRFQGRNSIL